MLLEPASGAPAWRSEDVLVRLGPELVGHVRAETHACALELGTDPHAERARARSPSWGRCARGCRARCARAGSASPSPARTRWCRPEDTQVSTGARYRELHASLRGLARREPTFALHVHVAVPDATLAIRALDAMRVHLPLLLALSANSPFLRGSDSGLASARTPVFQEFPRAGLPRAYGDYRSYVEAIDVLVRTRAIPEPTFVWWDARLQPRLGTLEVRVMDAQTRLARHRRDWPRSSSAWSASRRWRASPRPSSWPRTRCSRRTGSWPRATGSAPSSSTRAASAACRRASAWPRVLEACRPHAEALGCAARARAGRRAGGRPGAGAPARRGGRAQRPARPDADAPGGVRPRPRRAPPRRRPRRVAPALGGPRGLAAADHGPVLRDRRAARIAAPGARRLAHRAAAALALGVARARAVGLAAGRLACAPGRLWPFSDERVGGAERPRGAAQADVEDEQRGHQEELADGVARGVVGGAAHAANGARAPRRSATTRGPSRAARGSTRGRALR